MRRPVHDHLVRTFRELFLWYKDTRNTSGQHWVLHSTEYLGITYIICRCISTGLLPFKELIDIDHYHHDTENKDCFLRALLYKDKRLNLRIRRGKKKQFS
jgi:hypothetical protein